MYIEYFGDFSSNIKMLQIYLLRNRETIFDQKKRNRETIILKRAGEI